MAVHRTAGLVAAKLREWGIETVEGVGQTGVVGTIRGRRNGSRAIGLRADMDALAIREATGAAYASTTPGLMHGCGHDGHTTMLLGAARLLAEDPDFAGTVHLIFQPAEEGPAGAQEMLKDGLFERFPCDAVYGMHNMPGFSAGEFAIRKGPFMAAVARWVVRFHGPGGHGGAAPHLSADLTVVASHFVLGLQTIVGRNVPPLETAVISVGHIGGGDAKSFNVMPSLVEIVGTARCFSDAVAETISRRIEELSSGLAKLHGATSEVEVAWYTPALINADAQADVAIAAASAVGKVETNAPAVTGGEDFAFMLRRRPGAFIFVGNDAPGKQCSGLHTPTYNFNDDIIPAGVAWWLAVVREELGAQE
jgi:hippurate hydrolase